MDVIVTLLWFVVYAVIVGLFAWVLQIIVAKVPMDATIAQIINAAILVIALIAIVILLIQALSGSLAPPF